MSAKYNDESLADLAHEWVSATTDEAKHALACEAAKRSNASAAVALGAVVRFIGAVLPEIAALLEGEDRTAVLEVFATSFTFNNKIALLDTLRAYDAEGDVTRDRAARVTLDGMLAAKPDPAKLVALVRAARDLAERMERMLLGDAQRDEIARLRATRNAGLS